MAINNIGTGELYKLVDTGVVETAKTATGQLGVILVAAPNVYQLATGVAGVKIEGIALNDAVAGESFPIVKSGFVVVQSGALTAAMIPIALDAVGKFIAAGAGDFVVGLSMTAAGAADEEMLIELYQSGYVHP